ncbi:MAG TPA: hypothetical protein PKM73_08510 [Verrucomicrobiota bacterium]|nr:hypothetical protein [Verrucomicrobiota bacterium]HNU51842.1 hypothetical protein [Verrucomicrobiota bacterium]
MQLVLQENPREWRKFTCLSLIGPALLCGLLGWKRVLPPLGVALGLLLLAGVALAATLHPRAFRGYYRLGSRIAFRIARLLSWMILMAVFFLVVTPLGLLLRLLGKDPLALKRPPSATSYWQPARPESSFDKMF